MEGIHQAFMHAIYSLVLLPPSTRQAASTRFFKMQACVAPLSQQRTHQSASFGRRPGGDEKNKRQYRAAKKRPRALEGQACRNTEKRRQQKEQTGTRRIQFRTGQSCCSPEGRSRHVDVGSSPDSTSRTNSLPAHYAAILLCP